MLFTLYVQIHMNTFYYMVPWNKEGSPKKKIMCSNLHEFIRFLNK